MHDSTNIRFPDTAALQQAQRFEQAVLGWVALTLPATVEVLVKTYVPSHRANSELGRSIRRTMVILRVEQIEVSDTFPFNWGADFPSDRHVDIQIIDMLQSLHHQILLHFIASPI